MTLEAPCILILTTNASDAEVFRDLLSDFRDVRVCTDEAQFADAFARDQPAVLILGMRQVADSERCYLQIFRHAGNAIPPPYKTLLLCGKEDVKRAFDLCRTQYFDDYILFWPMVHDAPRLAMSVHHALRSMEITRSAAALPDLQLQARRIASLEASLDEARSTGSAHARHAREAIEAVGTSIRASLEAFGQRMINTGLDEALVVNDIAQITRALDQFHRESVDPPVAAALLAAAPVSRWIDDLSTRLEPELAAARSLGEQVAMLRPVILVVEDDDFMQKVLVQMLETEGYRVFAVASAARAAAFLRGRQPDLILMDVQLPDVDGIVLTRRFKAADAYAHIPVIMLTGQSQRQVLIDSREAGACDFIVKPFERETVLHKIALHLSTPDS